MHPAVSVIFFTVLSGAGFGFIALLGLGLPMPNEPVFATMMSALAFGLCVIGLISSTFHLGHPERAWRAFSQWRSSWLSREGVLSVITLGVFALYAGNWVFNGERHVLLGLVLTVLALLTIFATAMIYAQLKTVPSWHTWMTPVCYLAFGVSSGLMLASAFTTINSDALVNVAGGLLILSWVIKLMWWKRADTVGFSDTGSDTGTATGLGSIGKVKLLEKPHSGENYLTKEMVHQIGRKHAEKLRVIAKVLGGFVPAIIAILIWTTSAPTILMVVAFVFMLAGLFAERWLFFAEAKHAVSLYY